MNIIVYLYLERASINILGYIFIHQNHIKMLHRKNKTTGYSKTLQSLIHAFILMLPFNITRQLVVILYIYLVIFFLLANIDVLLHTDKKKRLSVKVLRVFLCCVKILCWKFFICLICIMSGIRKRLWLIVFSDST